jgi:hypothetical protein
MQDWSSNTYYGLISGNVGENVSIISMELTEVIAMSDSSPVALCEFMVVVHTN